MQPDKVSILRDPISLEPLQFVSESGNEGSTFLVNANTGKKFPVRDGIPKFLEDSDVTGPNRKFQKFYDMCAPIYDAMIKTYLYVRRLGNDEQMRTEYLKELEIKDGDRVLEVSIGTGSNLRYMPGSCQYFGLDISWGMLKRCQKNLKKWKMDFELFLGTAEHLPFADNEFDVVFHAGGIKFFSDKRRAIAEMIRVAKPGTKIMIMDQADKIAQDVLRVPIARQFFKGLREMTVAPVDLVPGDMQDIRLSHVLNGGCYLLEFRKPGGKDVRPSAEAVQRFSFARSENRPEDLTALLAS
jgi:ubiquinone/menaquinone biosynthesis C-methylase UbiE